jgi:hypothetical protein
MEDAKIFAQLKVEVYSKVEGNEIFSNWIDAKVGEATLLYDSTGFPVLYEVEILNGNDNVGTIEIWASKLLGTPYCGIKLPKIVKSTTKLPIKNSNKPREEIVYYNYPKKAYKIDVEIPNKNIKKMILVDIDTQKIITKKEQHPFREKIKEENITTTWEYWTQLLNQFKKYKMPPEPTIIAEILNVRHYQQLREAWCVGACSQMILDYHNDTVLSQYNLLNCYFIPEYETTCTGAGLDGVAYDDVVPGWNRLGYINTSKVNAPLTIGAARTEIDAGFPVMTPLAGLHMVTINGYVTGWNEMSEVHVLDPAWSSDETKSSYFVSLPNVFMMPFYFTIR